MPDRCSDAARDRGDALVASAAPARAFLLMEVPGPWGPDAWTTSRLDPVVGAEVCERASAAGVRPLLVRRPGPHPAAADEAERSWALVRVVTEPGSAQAAGHRWNRYRHDAELLDISFTDPRPARSDPGPATPIALVCTHGRHDLCCAVRGRPVAAALAGLSSWDVWESTHIGGCRFAPNVLALPSGELFGGLDAGAAPRVLGALAAGSVELGHHRGRYGDPPLLQAARHHAMRVTGDHRVDAFGAGRVLGRSELGQEVSLPRGRAEYRLHLGTRPSAPELLTCQAVSPAAVPEYELLSWQVSDSPRHA